MYWAAETKSEQYRIYYGKRSLGAYKKASSFNDNSLIFEQDPANLNRLFKIQPVIDHLLPKFQSISQQQVLCCDEQMVCFKRHVALKLCMPRKPYKWEYKVYMLCDTTGMVHNFEIYAKKIIPAVNFSDLGASVNIAF